MLEWLVRPDYVLRQDPKVIVTALRIVEREERLDAEAAQQEKSATGFVALGR